MTVGHLIIAAALVTGTVFAVRSVRGSYPRRWMTAVAAALRVSSAGALLIALFEPAVTIHRLPAAGRTLPILIDASESMSLFNADSVIRLLEERCANYPETPARPGRRPVWMLFGDSLRPHDTAAPYLPLDRNSLFPPVQRHPLLHSCDELIIVSDANWSNTSPFKDELSSKTVWYLPLAPQRKKPSLTCDAPDTLVTAAGASRTLPVVCSGTAINATKIMLTISDGSSRVAADTQEVPPGPFRHMFSIRLPPVPSGLQLYRIDAFSTGDTLRRCRYSLCRTVPATCTYTVRTAAPSLDVRFLRNALAGRKEFRELPAAEKNRADVQFLFSTTGEARSGPAGQALTVYLGTLPGAGKTGTPLKSGGHLLVENSTRNPFFGMPVDELPPITPIRPGKNIPITASWISVTDGHDTIPLVFRGVTGNRTFIGCGFSGFWQWDFLPLAHVSGEAESFQFSGRLLGAVAATLHELKTDTLLAYPSTQPAGGKPADFTIIFPSSTLHDLQQAELRLTVYDTLQKPCIDTTPALIASGEMFHRITLQPLAPGSYTVVCSLAVGSAPKKSEVPFEVMRTNAELTVTAQNENLLGEIGQPLSLTDTLQFNSLLTDASPSPEQEPVAQRFRFRRSWWLLAIILLSLGGEWTLRRFARLD